MASYPRRRLQAVTTSVKLWDYKRRTLVSGQELMCIQGFDLTQLRIPQPTYRLLNLMAGALPLIACVPLSKVCPQYRKNKMYDSFPCFSCNYMGGSLPGNAMTTSVLSALLVALQCFAWPVDLDSGRPLRRAPDVMHGPSSSNSEESSSSDSTDSEDDVEGSSASSNDCS